MLRRPPAIRTLLACFVVSLTSLAIATADDRADFFEKKIRPVLIEHCYKCHAADSKNVRGGLLVDSETGLLTGGESGAAIVPGEPDESLLLSAMKHESFEMPPDQRLPDEVIADFERWIRDGAVDPRKGGQTIERRTIDLAAGRKFWSFQPVKDVPIPPAGDRWARTPIDRFVAARMETAGLHPGEDAKASVVLRRLHFGLTGLPPTADDILNFEAAWQQDPDAAIDRVTSELLERPEFGERWGRHWLDVTRFAESSGGGRSLMFPDAWRFRDYVIDSFNQDKPFDQLIREHIAGDLLPWDTEAQHDEQVTGVGYLTLGPTNYEQQDKELLRMEVVDEQIDTMGRTFLGLTLGCARCHDHKFDPVPTADYYALAGIFRSTKTLVPGNVSGYVTTALKATGPATSDLEAWTKTERELKQQIEILKQKIGPQTLPRSVASKSVSGIVVDDVSASFEGQWKKSDHTASYVDAGYQHNEGRMQGHSVRFEVPVSEAGRYRVFVSWSAGPNRSSAVPVRVVHADGYKEITVNQQKAPAFDGLFHELGTFPFTDDDPAQISINAANAAAGVVIVDAVRLLPETEAVVDSEHQAPTETERQRLQTLEQELKAHTAKKPKPELVMSVHDQEQPADWHIHVRGGIRSLGPIVPRGIVSVAGSFDKDGKPVPLQIEDGTSGRRELAEWIASPDNPLTARVFVNRVWHYLLGEGLVRTPDNFGATGVAPTHPELLDYLARTFVEEDQWSVKRLIQRIVRSRVYRLQSEINPADPDNRLLTRAFRRRLEAEALRDAMLVVSGELNRDKRGGRSIGRLTTYDNGYDHGKYDQHLRSVYVPSFRNSMLEFFDVFDVANSNLVVGRRSVSTLPAQGLYLMNSPYVMERATQAAKSFVQTVSADPGSETQLVQTATLITLGRRPTAKESAILQEYVRSAGLSSDAGWSAVFQALFGSIDFRYID
ncbi:MAG: DUF1549 domain-containing protein [Fuerstiella sp.]